MSNIYALQGVDPAGYLPYMDVDEPYVPVDSKIFPEWISRDDGADGHRSGDGPFFIARKTASKVTGRRLFNGEVPVDVVNFGSNKEYRIEEQNYILYYDTWYGNAGPQGFSLCMAGVSFRISGGKYYYNGDAWCIYPYIHVKGNPKSNVVQAIKGWRSKWDSIPQTLRNHESIREAISWLRGKISSTGYKGLSKQNGNSYLYTVRTTDVEPIRVPIDQIGLKFGEYGYWATQVEGVSPVLTGGQGLHVGLFTSAYQHAVESLPSLHSNTINNVIELVETIISLANGLDLGDIKRLSKLADGLDIASDAWLRYRYQYKTTVSDMQEIVNCVSRLNALLSSSMKITAYGHDSDSTGAFHCALHVSSERLLSRSAARTFDFAPSLANAWDMVPFSFIVDWFTKLGSLLSGIDEWLYRPTFSSQVWYSYTNSYLDDSQAVIEVFFRFGGGTPLLPYWTMGGSSSKAWWLRVADSVALFFGR